MSDRELTLKQHRWVEVYLETGNATEAARQAGYQGDENTLRVVGSQNLTKHNIKIRIQARIEDSKITANEVIGTLASHARIDPTEAYEPGQNPVVDRLREKGLGHWLKSITTRRHWEGSGEDAVEVEVERIEFHNSFSAATQLSKILGLEKEPAKNDSEQMRSIVLDQLNRKLERGLTLTRAVAQLRFAELFRPEDIEWAASLSPDERQLQIQEFGRVD